MRPRGRHVTVLITFLLIVSSAGQFVAPVAAQPGADPKADSLGTGPEARTISDAIETALSDIAELQPSESGPVLADHQNSGVHVESDTDNVDGDGRTGIDETEDGDDVYGSVQAGVDNATIGQHVVVAPGTYREAVTVTTPEITLEAAGAVTFSGSDSQSIGLTIKADNVTVTGISLLSYTTHGIHVGGDGVTVRDVTASENGKAGIRLRNVEDSRILEVTTENNDEMGIWISGDSTRSVTIADSRTAGNGFFGIGLYNSDTATIRNVSVVGNENSGINVAETTDLLIANTTVSDSTFEGIQFSSTDRVTVRDSQIRDNGDLGIRVREIPLTTSPPAGSLKVVSSNFTHNDNEETFHDPGVGIEIKPDVPADQITIRDNRFQRNGVGVINENRSAVANATHNWWGDVSGPSGIGPGSGERLKGPIAYWPFYTDAAHTSLTPPDTTQPRVDLFDAKTTDGQTLEVQLNASETAILIDTEITNVDTGGRVATLDQRNFRGDDSNYTATTTLPSEGRYRATLNRLVDRAGNRGTTGQTAMVLADTTAPSVTLSPADGTEFSAGTDAVDIMAEYADAESGIDPATVSITVNGTDVTSAATIDDGNLTYTAGGLANGTSRTIAVTVADRAGNTQQTTANFSIAADKSAPKTIVVDDDGPADYRTIQAAVDNASSGNHIRVKSGVYHERVRIDKSLTLKTTEGAILDGENVGPGIAIPEGSGVSPTIDGFHIRGYRMGINASRTTGAFEIKNVTLTGNRLAGVGVQEAGGDWQVENADIHDNNYGASGVYARETTGNWVVSNATLDRNWMGLTATRSTSDWVVRDTVVRNNIRDGIRALSVSGDWRIDNVTVIGHDGNAGINLQSSKGDSTPEDGRITRSTIRNNGQGIKALSSSGAWTANRTTITDNNVGVDARRTSGAWRLESSRVENGTIGIRTHHSNDRWTVEHTTIANHTSVGVTVVGAGGGTIDHSRITDNALGVNATDASPQLNASHNWWGASDGPNGDFPGSGDSAVGNVTVDPFYTDEELTALGTASGAIIVDDDGPADFRTIQAAIDNASDDATISIRNGTYAEEVRLDKNLTLLGTDNAILDGATLSGDRFGITIPDDSIVSPTIAGLTIQNFSYGVDAYGTRGNWTIRNATIRNNDEGPSGASDGVYVSHSSGNWTIVDTTISDHVNQGIDASRSSGAWEVRDSRLVNDGRRLFEAFGTHVAANFASGPWTVANTTIAEGYNGITAPVSTGDWTVRDSEIRSAREIGIEANRSSGAWTVRNTTLTDNSQAIAAGETSGQWRVTESRLSDSKEPNVNTPHGALNAKGADPAGLATHNWWGAPDGPSGIGHGSGDILMGNVEYRPFYADAARTELVRESGAIVVDDDGPADYRTIQAAVDNASDDATISIRNGTYAEEVRLDKNLTLLGSERAILDGATLSDNRFGITIPARSTVEPTIAGLTVQNFSYGVGATRTRGDWTIRNATIRNNDEGPSGSSEGVQASYSSGNWTIIDSTIRNHELQSVVAYKSHGAWSIHESRIINDGRPVFESFGRHVFANGATGDWMVANTTIAGGYAGVNAKQSAANWTVRDSVIRNVRQTGIDANESSGAWTVRNTTITDNSLGVSAGETAGHWRITESRITDNGVPHDSLEDGGLNAGEADPAGIATHNWWAAPDGPSGIGPGSGQAIRGNVEYQPFYTDAAMTSLSATTPGTLVVDPADPTAYHSIQNAVDNASDGDTVEVRPATYHESVTVEKNLTLVAPDGATLDGSTHDMLAPGLTIPAGTPAAPVIDGFTITDFGYGVNAADSTGNWTLRNVTIANSLDEGVEVEQSNGDWVIQNATIRNSGNNGVSPKSASGNWEIRGTTITDSDTGVHAESTTGDWEIRDATIKRSSDNGVRALDASGDWEIRETTVTNNTGFGVDAEQANGDWTIRNATITHSAGYGVGAGDSSGNWTVSDTTIANITRSGFWWVTADGTGLYAGASHGRWAVHGTTITDTTADGLNATDAAPRGNATHNYWGAPDGPSGDFPGSGDAAVGNVTVQPFYTDAAITSLSTTKPGALVVDLSDPTAYHSIQNAVDNASDGDTVEVRPGTYPEAVHLTKNVTLVAPDGATLDGSTVSTPHAITIAAGSNAAPTVSGFRITHYQSGVFAPQSEGAWTVADTEIDHVKYGVLAASTAGAWTVENTSIHTVRDIGITAPQATGAWTVRDVTVRDSADEGIVAWRSTNNWTVADTAIENVSTGIVADFASGDWAIERSSIVNTGADGIAASQANGTWAIRNVAIRNPNDDGIDTWGSTGDWTITDIAIEHPADVGILADSTRGRWTIANATITDTGDDGIAASHTNESWRIRNVEIRNSQGRGIDTAPSTGAWTIQDTSINGSGEFGITAGDSTGRWTVRSSTVANVETGIDAPGVSAAWRVRDTTVRDTFVGVDAHESTGPWRVTDAQLHDTIVAIDAENTSGDWVLADSRVANNTVAGVYARHSSSNWTVRHSNLTENGGVIGLNGEAVRSHAVDAQHATGDWTVVESRLTDNDGAALNATNSTKNGNATHNYWGAADGPAGIAPGAGDGLVGNAAYRPFYTDAAMTTLSAGTPGTLVVDPTDPTAYDAIQAAVDDATPGDTVDVRAGVYPETVTVDKPLTLTGDPGDASAGPAPDAPVLEGDGVREFGIVIDDDPTNVTIEGFEIRNATNTGVASFSRMTDVTVRDSHVHDIDEAPYSAGISTFQLDVVHEDVRLVNNRIEAVGGTGVILQNVHDATVRDNEFVGTTDVDTAVYGPGSVGGVSVAAWANRTDLTTRDVRVDDNRFSGTFVSRAVGVFPRNLTAGTHARVEDLRVRDNTIAGADVQAGLVVAPNGTNTAVADLDARNNSYQSVNRGIVVDGSRGALERITVTDSTLGSVATDAIEVRGGDATALGVHATAITGSGDAALVNDATGTVNATHNYWGAPDGPSGIANGSGGEIQGDAAYRPFYTDAAMTTLAFPDDTPPEMSVSPADGTTFPAGTSTVTVVVNYTDAGLGVDPANVSLVFDGLDKTGQATITDDQATYTATDLANGTTHSVIATVPDRAGNRREVQTSFQVQPTPTLAVTSATISQSTARVGEAVTVTATVENTGSAPVAASVPLRVNDTTVASRLVSLAAGQSRTVTFSHAIDHAGSYQVAVADTPAGTLTVTDGPLTLIVANDGSGDFQSIEHAVENATDGDIVVVTAGTYHESVTLDKNITLMGRNAPVLDGSPLAADAAGITIPPRSPATPTIRGLEIRNYDVGIHARETTGTWRVQNVTLADNERGLATLGSSGQWLLLDATVTDNHLGVDAAGTAARWTVAGSTITNNSAVGLRGPQAVAGWTAVDTHIAGNDVGVRAHGSGHITLTRTRITDNRVGVNATGSPTPVNATNNWWGAADGPSRDFPGSGDPATGTLVVRPFYADRALTTRSTGPQIALSFEDGAPGDTTMPDPWYVRNGDGTIAITGDPQFVTHGERAVHLVSSGRIDNGTEVAVDLNLTGVATIEFDVMLASGNPDHGGANVNLAPSGRAPVKLNKRFGDAEGVWHHDVTVDVSDLAGNQTLYTRVTGSNNEVYWDDVRLSDAGGTPVPVQEALADRPVNQPPTANLTVTPDHAAVGDTVAFDARNATDRDGTVTSYTWQLGDGTTATGETVSHTYAEPGTYPVTLVVRDDDGAVDQASATVTVDQAVPPPLPPAQLSLANVSVPDAVTAGDPLVATATVENPTNVPLTGNVTFALTNVTTVNRSVTLDSGENTTVEISLATASLAAGTYDWSLSTAGAGAGDTLEVRPTSPGPRPPIERWNVTTGQFFGDEGPALARTEDGDYVLAGSTMDDDVRVVRVAANGTVEWVRTYSNDGADEANDLVPTADGGVVVLADTAPEEEAQTTLPDEDVWLFKLAADGSIEWNRTYGGEGHDSADAIVRSWSGDYVVAGSTIPPDAASQGWVFAVNESGAIQWNTSLGGDDSDTTEDLVRTADGGYAVVGTTFRSASADETTFIVRLAQNGSMLWQQLYNIDGEEEANAIVRRPEGGFLLVGHWESPELIIDSDENGGGGGVSEPDGLIDEEADAGWLFAVDETGSRAWTEIHDGPGRDALTAAVPSFAGGYLLVGYTSSFDAEDTDAWLLGANATGVERWNTTSGFNGSDAARDVLRTPAGEYAVGGWRSDDEQRFWLATYDAAVADLVVTRLGLADLTVPANEPATLTVTLQNNGSVPNARNLSFTADGRVIDHRTVTLAAGATKTVTFRHAFETPGDHTIGIQGVGARTVAVTEPAGPTVALPDTSLSVNATTTVPLSLTTAPNGLSGYNLTVTVADPATATIVNATYADRFDLTEAPRIGPNNASVRLRAVDIQDRTVPNDTDIPLATVTIQGTGEGVTRLDASVGQMDDDTGGVVDPATNGSTVTVRNVTVVCAGCDRPTDPDGDGLYEDLNGNGRFDFNDIVTYFEAFESAAIRDHVPSFDANGNGRIDFDDIVSYFEEI